MNEIALIIGIGIVAIGILAFTFMWDKKEHLMLRLLGSFFFIGILLLIPKVALDNTEHCSFEVINSTISGSTTNYNYERICVANTNSTGSVFYRVVVWFMRVFVTYVFVYLNWVVWVKKFAFMKGWIK